MGIPTRHEPENIVYLHENGEVFTIFQEFIWTEYFHRLNSFHVITTLKFALKLIDTHSTVRGFQIDVTEAIVAEVTGLPNIGTRWFGLKATNSIAVHKFLVAGEIVQPRGR